MVKPGGVWPIETLKTATEEDIGKLATARTADGSLIWMGRVAAHCASPMVMIIDRHGNRLWWRADMVAVHSMAEDEVVFLTGDFGKIAQPDFSNATIPAR